MNVSRLNRIIIYFVTVYIPAYDIQLQNDNNEYDGRKYRATDANIV